MIVRVAMIGFGTIGKAVAHGLTSPDGPQLAGVLVRDRAVEETRQALPGHVEVTSDLSRLLALAPDLVVECAGQEAVRTYARSVLANGTSLMAISTGALAAPGFPESLTDAASGNAQLIVPAGAIAGLDGLGALKAAGLREVTYTSTKPPLAWRGTPAEDLVRLDTIQEPVAFFEGSARRAALEYPKNANLAATVALAGLDFDRTRVRLIADPKAAGNSARIDADSEVGTMTVLMAAHATTNPKTSASVAYSILHAIRTRSARLVI
jgi:aspartate dehydrogenase